MSILYNDNNEFCAKWLENLIGAGDLEYGFVSNKDIILLNYSDLSAFKQCHLFCGIGGWPLALKMAGWPQDETVWTGSCPCQPFSQASQLRKKTADDRHLWPDFVQLIEKYRPPTIFGEQIAGSDGREWFAGIRADLEQLGYAVGAADLPAACVSAPHIRQRLFWVADSCFEGLERFKQKRERLRFTAAETSAKRSHGCIREKFYNSTNANIISTYNGLSKSMDIIRAFGNSVVPDVAAEFVLNFMEL